MTDTRPIRVALYARVSTSNHGQNVTLQTRELIIEHRGWQFAGEYVDLGISGSKNRRPELDRLMADAHQHQFDVLIVWKFDPFARPVSHLLRVLETFQALGIDFVSLSESLDTSTPAGKKVFTVLGAVAELERSLIVERVKAGRESWLGVPYSDRFRYLSFFSADARVSKDVKVSEKYSLRLSLSMFNMTNHFNALDVYANTGDPRYGVFMGNYKPKVGVWLRAPLQVHTRLQRTTTIPERRGSQFGE